MLAYISSDCWRVILGWLTLSDLLRLRAVSRDTRARLGKGWAYVRCDFDLDRAFIGLRSVAGARLLWAAYPSEARHETTLRVALDRACTAGWLSKARWLIAYVRRHPSVWSPHDHGLLASACGGGHTATARWVANHFGLGADRPGSLDGALMNACRGGHLSMVQWLVKRFGLDVDITRSAVWVRDRIFAALGAACDHGQLTVAQWLAETFQYVKMYDLLPLLSDVSAIGHLAVVQWLVLRFDIPEPTTQRALYIDPMRRASQYGHSAIAVWLKRHWRN